VERSRWGTTDSSRDSRGQIPGGHSYSGPSGAIYRKGHLGPATPTGHLGPATPRRPGGGGGPNFACCPDIPSWTSDRLVGPLRSRGQAPIGPQSLFPQPSHDSDSLPGASSAGPSTPSNCQHTVELRMSPRFPIVEEAGRPVGAYRSGCSLWGGWAASAFPRALSPPSCSAAIPAA
jgi:hypothetical protein